MKSKSIICLFSLVAICSLHAVQEAASPQQAEKSKDTTVSPETESLAKAGDRLLKEGKTDEALSKFEAGWKETKGKDCLDGICTVYLLHKDTAGIGKYIGPIFEFAKTDLTFLKIAIGYSVQVKDKDLFVKCLGNIDEKQLQENPALALGVARGSIRFFTEKKGDISAPSPK